MVGWKGTDVVKYKIVDFSCLLNWLRVSLLGFSSFCFTLSTMSFAVRGVHFVRSWCRPCSVPCMGSADTVFGGWRGTVIVADIEVYVSRFSVDRRGFVGVDEDVHVWKRSILWMVFYGVLSSVRELRNVMNPSSKKSKNRMNLQWTGIPCSHKSAKIANFSCQKRVVPNGIGIWNLALYILSWTIGEIVSRKPLL